MDSLISISGDAPVHLVSYWLGTLVGLGIPYSISPESPLYREMRDNERRITEEVRLARLNPQEKTTNKDGYRVIYSAGDSDSIKVTVKHG